MIEPEYTSTGKLFRVTETPWYLREGSRGGYGFRGTVSPNVFAEGGDVVYVWMKNQAAELEIKQYVAYVEDCMDNLCDAYGIDLWRVHGKPTGVV